VALYCHTLHDAASRGTRAVPRAVGATGDGERNACRAGRAWRAAHGTTAIRWQACQTGAFRSADVLTYSASSATRQLPCFRASQWRDATAAAAVMSVLVAVPARQRVALTMLGVERLRAPSALRRWPRRACCGAGPPACVRSVCSDWPKAIQVHSWPVAT
jgi:hypothetical protein